jgi:peptidoglycan hydrolase-like protein with peptidoglycan-binding domain
MISSGGLMNVRQAQQMLKTLGGPAGDTAMSGLAIDGLWGGQTSTAVRHYQGIKRIAVTGQIDPNTAQALANDYNQFIASGGQPVTS